MIVVEVKAMKDLAVWLGGLALLVIPLVAGCRGRMYVAQCGGGVNDCGCDGPVWGEGQSRSKAPPCPDGVGEGAPRCRCAPAEGCGSPEE